MRGYGLHPVCSWPQFHLMHNEETATELISNFPGFSHTEEEEGLRWSPCPKMTLSGSPFPAREELEARANAQPAVSLKRSQSTHPNPLLLKSGLPRGSEEIPA